MPDVLKSFMLSNINFSKKYYVNNLMFPALSNFANVKNILRKLFKMFDLHDSINMNLH